MAISITPEQVQDILADSTAVVDAYITTAIAFAEAVFDGVTIPTALLDEITVWLSAHFYSVNTPPARQLTIHSGSISYHVPTLKAGLESSMYGMQATALDITGTLKDISSGAKRPFIKVI